MSLPFNLRKFYSPDDNEGIIPPKDTTNTDDKDDVIEFLADENENKDEILDLEDKKPVKKTVDKAETKTTKEKDETDEDDEEKDEDETEDELKELEEELEGPTEEQLELMVPVRRREILKKYPELFKDFPYLERAYYREQQFTEILPTIEEAKTAVEKAQVLDNFERELMTGSTEKILKAVKAENEDGFNKLVDEYLPTLARVDKDAYNHVLSSVIKDTIIAMVEESDAANNESLKAAAQILNQFVFASSKFEPHKPLTSNKPKDTKVNEHEAEHNQFLKERFEVTKNDLETRVNNTLKSTIDANIDPKKSMTDYVRKNASREVIETLENLVSRDTRFKTLMDKLWEASYKEKFSKESTDRIRTAYLSKAKTLLPSVIKKARNDALKGRGKRVTEDTEEIKESKTKDKTRPNSSVDNKKDLSELDKSKTTYELLMED